MDLAVCTLAENTELCVFAEFGLAQLNQWWRGMSGLDHLGMAILGERVTAHAGVPFCLVCLF